MSEREIKGWITVNGVHVPLFEGESRQDAINRHIAKVNEDKKTDQIAKNKAQADELNNKSKTRNDDAPKPKNESETKSKNLADSLTDNTDFKAWIKENMSNPEFKSFGRENGMDEVKNLWYQKRASEELKDVHEMKIEDAIKQVKDTVPARYIEEWFRAANSGVKPNLVTSILSNKGILNAGLNMAYENYKNDLELRNIRTHADEKPLSFKKWLTTPQTMYRGEYGQKHVKSDIFLSYSTDKNIAEKFGKNVSEVKIRPIDTWGSYQTTAEQEFLVPLSKLSK